MCYGCVGDPAHQGDQIVICEVGTDDAGFAGTVQQCATDSAQSGLQLGGVRQFVDGCRIDGRKGGIGDLGLDKYEMRLCRCLSAASCNAWTITAPTEKAIVQWGHSGD